MASLLRDQVILQMTLRGFSPRTHESYLHAMEELARCYMRALDSLTCLEVQQFLNELISVRKLAWSTINVYFSAYRFLYEKVLGWEVKRFSIPPRGRSGKRPGVLSQQEVHRLINVHSNLKHRALLTMAYGSGLRVSELVVLKPKHIDRDRMMLFVEQGKGHKDRYTVLSAVGLKRLEEHWQANGPMKYFFFGRDKSRPMSTATALQVYHQALEKAGVRHVGGIHVLRHCFATHLMEQGMDIYTIKKWMGHRALATTGRYMHVTDEYLKQLVSPLDILRSR